MGSTLHTHQVSIYSIPPMNHLFMKCPHPLMKYPQMLTPRVIFAVKSYVMSPWINTNIESYQKFTGSYIKNVQHIDLELYCSVRKYTCLLGGCYTVQNEEFLICKVVCLELSKLRSVFSENMRLFVCVSIFHNRKGSCFLYEPTFEKFWKFIHEGDLWSSFIV